MVPSTTKRLPTKHIDGTPLGAVPEPDHLYNPGLVSVSTFPLSIGVIAPPRIYFLGDTNIGTVSIETPSDYDNINASGCYIIDGNDPSSVIGDYGRLFVCRVRNNDSFMLQVKIAANNGGINYRFKKNGVWSQVWESL